MDGNDDCDIDLEDVEGTWAWDGSVQNFPPEPGVPWPMMPGNLDGMCGGDDEPSGSSPPPLPAAMVESREGLAGVEYLVGRMDEKGEKVVITKNGKRMALHAYTFFFSCDVMDVLLVKVLRHLWAWSSWIFYLKYSSFPSLY